MSEDTNFPPRIAVCASLLIILHNFQEQDRIADPRFVEKAKQPAMRQISLSASFDARGCLVSTVTLSETAFWSPTGRNLLILGVDV